MPDIENKTIESARANAGFVTPKERISDMKNARLSSERKDNRIVNHAIVVII